MLEGFGEEGGGGGLTLRNRVQSRIVIAVRNFRCEISAWRTPVGSSEDWRVFSWWRRGEVDRNSVRRCRIRLSSAAWVCLDSSKIMCAAAATSALLLDTRFSGQKPSFRCSTSPGCLRLEYFIARNAQVRHLVWSGGADGDCTSHFGLNSRLMWVLSWSDVMSVIRVPYVSSSARYTP